MGRFQPSNRMIVGIALLLFGGVLLGVGIHHVVKIGTCSSTGYSRYGGRVPDRPSGDRLVDRVHDRRDLPDRHRRPGRRQRRCAGLILAITFGAIGAGALTVGFESGVSSGKKTFGIIFGGFFLAAGAIAALASAWAAVSRTLWASPRGPATAGGLTSSVFGSTNAGEPDAIMGAYAAGGSNPRPPAPVSRPAAVA